MGKKDKAAKKKGKGAEKTAEKTQKNIKAKMKKTTGEDDIEGIVASIEAEEKRRSEVKETSLGVAGPTARRANFSLVTRPDGGGGASPDLVLFGGEFFNGQKTQMNHDLLFYNTKRRDWSQVSSPAGPPPRSSHQAVATPHSGGQMWLFGGEYASPSETQFYHYKDLWCYHFASRRWEKVSAAGGPSSRSGHRMVLCKQHLVVFGGFHDNLRESKYFNDVHAFDLSNREWKKLTISGAAPVARSGCAMVALPDSRILIFGGYAKERDKREAEKGRTMSDMFLLGVDKHDDGSLTKWRWQAVKQVGVRPAQARSGVSACAASAAGPVNKVYFFGGVQDVEEDEESLEGKFFNDLHAVVVENEKATWSKIELSGKQEPMSAAGAAQKRSDRLQRRRKDDKECGEKEKESGDDDDDEAADDGDAEANDDGDAEAEAAADGIGRLEAMQIAADPRVGVGGGGGSTVTVESGAFTVTSTVGLAGGADGCAVAGGAGAAAEAPPVAPCPRFGAALAVRQGRLYLYGGLLEEGEKQFTFNDFYSIDLHKFDEWQVLIENDLKTMEWFDEEVSDFSDDDEDDEDGEDDDGESDEGDEMEAE